MRAVDGSSADRFCGASVGVNGDVGGAQAELAARAPSRSAVVASTIDGSSARAMRPAGRLTLSIGRPKSVASRQRLLRGCRAATASRSGSACLAATSAVPTATGAGAGAQRAGEVGVEALAVLEEVGVAVLVAGAGDQRGAACWANACAQSSGCVTPGTPSRVDDVVAGVAAGAEDDGVREVDGRARELAWRSSSSCSRRPARCWR